MFTYCDFLVFFQEITQNNVNMHVRKTSELVNPRKLNREVARVTVPSNSIGISIMYPVEKLVLLLSVSQFTMDVSNHLCF